MKKLLSVLLLCPALAMAQEVITETPAPKVKKWEIGLNTGVALSGQKGMTFYDDAFLVGRNNVSFYRNFSSSQVGGRVEVGYGPIDESWFIAPEVVVNKTFSFKHLYIYGGGSVGYKRKDHGSLVNNISSGYVTGLQSGIVYHLGKRISLNAEASVKSEQMWTNVTETFPMYNSSSYYTRTYRATYFDLYFPMSLGVRYRF